MKLRIERDEFPDPPPRDWDNVGTMVCWHHRYILGDEQPSEDPDAWLNNLADEYLGDIPERVEQAANYFYGTSSRFGDVAYLKRAREEALYGANRSDIDHARTKAWIRREMSEGDDLARIDTDLAREIARLEALIGKWNVVMLPLYLYDHSGITMSTGSFGCPWDSGQVGFIYMTREKAEENWPSLKDDPDALRLKAEERLEAEVEVYDQYLTGEVYGYVIEDDDGEEVESCWGFYGEEDAQQEGEKALKRLEQEEVA